jgi:hypothetical protein
LVDIDLCPVLQLRHAPEMPEILDGGAAQAIGLAARRGLIAAEMADDRWRRGASGSPCRRCCA